LRSIQTIGSWFVTSDPIRKRAEGKTHRAALRALKRQLATIVYYRLRDDLCTRDGRSAAAISTAA
jgi:hypothetical protein